MINEFRGNYYFLSNFSDSKIEYDGYIYLNAEAAFQAQKNSSSTYKYMMQFQDASTAKKEGRKVKLRPDWEQVKDKIMYYVVKAKFEQNKDLRDKLLATGDKYLTEGNNWHDNYWGVCKCNSSKCLDKVGRNKLGKILMQIREELRPSTIPGGNLSPYKHVKTINLK